MIYCYLQWRCYLEGTISYMHTDHEPLTWLSTQKHLSRRQARWMDIMSRYSYTVLYVRGDNNVVAEALSRILTLNDDGELPLPYSDHPDLLLTLTRSPRLSSSTEPGSGNGQAGGSSSEGCESLISYASGSDHCEPASLCLVGGGKRPERHSGASGLTFFSCVRSVALAGRTRRSPGTSVGEFGGSRCHGPNHSGEQLQDSTM